MSATIESIYRYPVKGLSPERLDRATLTAGAEFPADRMFAVENGPSGFDPAAPALRAENQVPDADAQRAPGGARTRYDDATGILSIEQDGRSAVRADLAGKDGRLAVEAFFRRFMPAELRGPPKVLTAPPGYSFSDVAAEDRVDHQSGVRVGARNRRRRSRQPAALPRQSLRRRLARLARIRAAGARDRHRRGAAQGDEAHHALRGDQCRSRYRRCATSRSRRR